MYEMRASIRDNQSVEDGRTRVKTHAGIISEAMLYEALLARDPDDGQNLLMYAVRWGRESWFLHLVRCIQDQVNNTFVSPRNRELVKSSCTLSSSSGSSCVRLARMATRQKNKPKEIKTGCNHVCSVFLMSHPAAKKKKGGWVWFKLKGKCAHGCRLLHEDVGNGDGLRPDRVGLKGNSCVRIRSPPPLLLPPPAARATTWVQTSPLCSWGLTCS